jgi:hypothetical protein
MTIPLASIAQVRILSEEMVEPVPPCDMLPDDLAPTIRFIEQQIRKGLPEPKPFSLGHCRWLVNRS